MGPIYVLTESEIDQLRNALADPNRKAYKVSVCVDGGAKFKINEGTWSPPMGELLPQ